MKGVKGQVANQPSDYVRNTRPLPDGCIEWTAMKLNEGYGHFSVHGKMVLAHRLAYECTHGPIPEGIDVLHKCDRPSCVNPDHLFLGTAKENAEDCAQKGRISRGERHSQVTWCRKITAANAREIFRRKQAGENPGDIARDYPITPTAIRNVGIRSWKWLLNPQ